MLLNRRWARLLFSLAVGVVSTGCPGERAGDACLERLCPDNAPLCFNYTCGEESTALACCGGRLEAIAGCGSCDVSASGEISCTVSSTVIVICGRAFSFDEN
jgi:hypothetical protein